MAGRRSFVDEHPTPAGADFPDALRRFPARREEFHRGEGTLGWHDHDHAYATVESAVHLRRLDAPGTLQPIEHRIAVPAAALQHRFEPVGKYPRQVVAQTSAGDVRQA